MKQKTVDLHNHSFYSDGTMTPAEILSAALKKNVGILAITDHDILEGSAELLELSSKYDIKCIPGVELDALENGTNIHILGYGMDIKDEFFRQFVKNNRSMLDLVNYKLIERMQKEEASITVHEYEAYDYDHRKGGWKALHYLMEKGFTKSLKEGLAFYSRYGCTYDCVEFPSIETVCGHIHSAGGKAILAHPGVSIKLQDLKEFQKEVLRLIRFGIDGLEYYYPTHTEEITKSCVGICQNYNLMITCGSDCHGTFGTAEVGVMNIPIQCLKLGDLIQ